MGELHVQSLEVTGGDPVIKAPPPATVPKLRYAHARSVTYPSPMDGSLQLGNGDMTVVVRHGNGSEGKRYGVYFVCTVGQPLDGRGVIFPISLKDS